MAQKAVLYRMYMDSHICPSGMRARDLLSRKGYELDDNLITSREEQEAFKAKHNVKTTPQIWIDGEHVGGFDALKEKLGVPSKDKNALSYTPVIAIFAVTALMAMAASYAISGSVATVRAAEWFIAFSMCALGIQKLRDLDSFTNTFITYDLLAMKHLRYAYFYPFAEVGAGVLMIAGALTWISAPVALFIAGINGVSVFKAVYIDKRNLKCACVGGNSNVPLGFISLTENVMMVAMALWMGAGLFG
ncbi:MauE/DoxX family redox-associated membrane protein [Pseudahrensia aquimaris]|uniref:Methylamine utilization protein MauE n=1 Tax=Pseudahrensia aquimaris TaxID=744461 RepID=A0ABW3FK01_9HYPH